MRRTRDGKENFAGEETLDGKETCRGRNTRRKRNFVQEEKATGNSSGAMENQHKLLREIAIHIQGRENLAKPIL
jgi:hypothetical protein